MTETNWGVNFDGDKNLEEKLFAMIQDKLREIGGIDEEFLNNIIGYVSPHIESS